MYNRGGEFKYCTFGAFKLLTIKSCARHGFRDEIMNILKITVLVTCTISFICTNAQKLSQIDFGLNEYGILSGDFTCSGSDQLWSYPYSEVGLGGMDHPLHNITIYDERMESISKIYSETGAIPFTYTNASSIRNFIVTQNLFNKDNLYELFSPLSYDSEKELVKGLKIQNEEGKILAEIPFENGLYLQRFSSCYHNDLNPIRIVSLGNENKGTKYYYIFCDLQTSNMEETITQVYSFERGKISTSIKKVRDIPQIKVSPTLPQKNETIKVNLGDMKSAQKLYVVDTNGKVCFTQSIQPGQENVELSTNGMPAGMYIIRVSDGNKDVDNCRVIIR